MVASESGDGIKAKIISFLFEVREP